jgi:hypothetical protein
MSINRPTLSIRAIAARATTKERKTLRVRKKSCLQGTLHQQSKGQVGMHAVLNKSLKNEKYYSKFFSHKK